MLSAPVTVDKEVVSSISRGVLVFAAVAPGDTEKEIDSMASKIIRMKLWDDESGKRVSRASLVTVTLLGLTRGAQWKKSVSDIEGEVLCGRLPRRVHDKPFSALPLIVRLISLSRQYLSLLYWLGRKKGPSLTSTEP